MLKTFPLFSCVTLTIASIVVGACAIIFFNNGTYFSIELSFFIIFLTILLVLYLFFIKRIGLLSLMMFITFSLPFIHFLDHIFFDFNSRPLVVWGFPVLYNPWLIYEDVITLTAMMSAVGCLGLVLGFSLSSNQLKFVEKRSFYEPDERENKLNISMNFILLAFGLLFSFLSAPADLVTRSAYTQSEAIFSNRGFDSAWMVSYILFSFAYCDAWLDRGTSRGKIKRTIVLITIIFSIIYFQILRGDRESFSWVVGLFILPYFFSSAFHDLRPIRLSFLTVLLAFFTILVINFVIGFARYNVTGVSLIEFLSIIDSAVQTGQIRATSIFTGTWTAALLTPVSVAGSYLYGDFEFKGGSDYINLFLSLPPGFIANALDYVRPIDAANFSSPAYEMRYGQGGTHAIVLPFRNFLMAGVLLISALYAFFVSRCERMMLKNISVKYTALFPILLMTFPHWLWYGEKSIINAIIIWYLTVWIYRVFYTLPVLYKTKLN